MEIRTELCYSVKSSKDLLIISKRIFEFYPKVKFVRRCDKMKTISKEIIATYEIKIPFVVNKVRRERSWLGDGMQQDDINCFQEWTEEVKVYDKRLLQQLIKEKMTFHQL